MDLQGINFQGVEWQRIKRYLQELKDVKIKLLIGSDSHDKSNQIRGSLQLIDQILNQETAASRPQA